jgi:hypothetical protein
MRFVVARRSALCKMDTTPNDAARPGMNESTTAENLPVETRRLEGNRLSIAHLLLWTAATALVFSCCERPPAPSQIGIGGFSQPGTNVEAARDRERQRFWQMLQNRYLINLAFAPIYGFALAGFMLASWRITNAKSGFPTQPGHWLLVVIGSATALVAAKLRLSLPPPASDYEDSMYLLIVALMSLLAGFKVGDSLWRVPLLIFGGSILLLSPLPALAPGPGGGTLVTMAMFGVGTAFILALVCAATEVARCDRGDIFHWTGVATLIGVVGHLMGWFFASWL